MCIRDRYIDALSVKTLNLENASISYNVENQVSPIIYTLNNVSFHAYGFMLDSTSSRSGKLLYCDNFDFVTNQPQTLLVNNDFKLETDSICLSTQDSIKMCIRDRDITNLAPVFTLTPGATIKPASGTAFDFTTPRTYTVTSEDGHWTKTYTVRCIVSGVSTEYHFEHITMEPKNERYQIFYDFTSNGDSVTWASGNAGFGLTGVPKTPLDYPTMQDDNGYVGKYAKLVTRSTCLLYTSRCG